MRRIGAGFAPSQAGDAIRLLIAGVLMMSRSNRSIVLFALLVALPLVWRADVATQPAPVNPTAAAIEEFKTRVAAYMELHDRLEAEVGQLESKLEQSGKPHLLEFLEAWRASRGSL